MKALNHICTSIFVIWTFSNAVLLKGQGTFQNLDFESANLTPIPNGQFGTYVSTGSALPDWTAEIGNQEVTQVLQNSLTLGNASIDILGPDWDSRAILQGQYTLVLQPGADPFGSGQNVSASLSQVGLVPSNAKSLVFDAVITGPFSVSLGGQGLSVVSFGSGANYTEYGANIPASFAGRTESLTITALAGPWATDSFDAFSFSGSSVIPESDPSVLASLAAFFWVAYKRLLLRPRTC